MNSNLGVDGVTSQATMNALIQFVEQFINMFARCVRQLVSGVDTPKTTPACVQLRLQFKGDETSGICH